MMNPRQYDIIGTKESGVNPVKIVGVHYKREGEPQRHKEEKELRIVDCGLRI